jgi:hypothetical protein
VASQVKPLVGGAWNGISLTTTSGPTKKDTTYGVTVPPGATGAALLACNEWHNAAGLGTASARAQKRAKALGFQLQEV